jgi:hypothetical protein
MDMARNGFRFLGRRGKRIASVVGLPMARERETSSLSNVLLQLLGAAAGLVVLMTLLGALGNWWRYKTLDLPNNAPIAALSQTTLLIEGVNELAPGILTGFVAAGLSLLIRPYVRRVPRWLPALWVAFVLGASAAAWAIWTIDAGIYVCSAGLVLFLTLTPLSTSLVGIAVYFVVVAVVTIITTIEIIKPPTHLERVVLAVQDHPNSPIHGFWIAATSDTVYVAPQLPGHCQVSGGIVGFPESSVKRIFLGQSVKVYPRDFKDVVKPCGH